MALPRLLDSRRVRRLLGLALAAKGLAGLLAPRLTATVVTRLSLREVYDNPDELEPRDTYVELIRNASAGLLVAGVVTAVRATAGTTPTATDGADEDGEPTATGDDDEDGEPTATGEDDEDDGEPTATGDDDEDGEPTATDGEGEGDH